MAEALEQGQLGLDYDQDDPIRTIDALEFNRNLYSKNIVEEFKMLRYQLSMGHLMEGSFASSRAWEMHRLKIRSKWMYLEKYVGVRVSQSF